jgi:uncharacterized protein YkwD
MKAGRKYVFLALIIGMFISCNKDDNDYPHAFLENEVLEQINAHRSALNIQELVAHEKITSQARKHSGNMAKGMVPFGHDGFSDRISIIKEFMSDVNRSAENVLYGSDDAQAAIGAWLQSEGHRKNIEGNYTHTGIGIAQDKDGTYFYTQIFVGTQ